VARLKVTLVAVAILCVTRMFSAEATPLANVASPGMKFRDCAECPQMIVIPSGKFTMTRKSASDGRHDDDPEAISKRMPAREVSIASFAMGIYDVTRAEFAAFVQEAHRTTQDGCLIWNGAAWIDDKTKNWRSPGFRQTARDPVVCVNWQDAQAYAEWLNAKVSNLQHDTRGRANGHYRLPSWEEEEYAAGGGATTAYYWGPEARRERANYGEDRCFPCQPARRGADRWLYTSPVGSFPPNAFGLYDMAGNVWLWAGNCLHGSPSGKVSEPLEWNGPCKVSAIHGGSWLDNPEYLRVGEYSLDVRTTRTQTLGFRVVRTLAPEASDVVGVAGQGTAAVSAPDVSTNMPSARARVPGRVFRDCPQCPEMIVIPAGSFAMGAPEHGGWDTRDVPEHRVTIDKDFAVGMYDVTREEYSFFVQKTGRRDGTGCDVLDPPERWITDRTRNWRDPAFQQTDRDPVVCVSWEDAQAYVQWLNSQVEGQHRSAGGMSIGPYRLLSEAEWEYAARAGSSTPYPWGDAANHSYANYGLEECPPCGAAKEGKDRWYFTSPVGVFEPNAFGLYDMSGNVWQWTQDCMHYGYAGAPEDGSVWSGGECRLRVLRGGSWLDPSILITVTLRNPWAPDSHNNANGFRVARSLD
jgi:formylglycine-generating enzyme required for sulfatase activity